MEVELLKYVIISLLFYYMTVTTIGENLGQTMYSQKTPHSLPSRASYGVSVVTILYRIDHVRMEPYCLTPLLCCYPDFLACSSSDDAPVVLFVSKMVSTQRKMLPQHRAKWVWTSMTPFINMDH